MRPLTFTSFILACAVLLALSSQASSGTSTNGEIGGQQSARLSSSSQAPSSPELRRPNKNDGGGGSHTNNVRPGARSMLRPWVPGFQYAGGKQQSEDEEQTQVEENTPGAGPDFGDVEETSGFENTMGAEINNNVQWYDDRGVEIKSNDGGHITRFGDTYYWVGNDLDTAGNGNDIHMYSSKTLGSSDWKWEGMMVDHEPGRYAGTCTLVQNPTTNKYMIICKGLNIYESDNINGPYENTMNIWPSMVPFHTGYAWGGMSVYQEGEDAYLVVSRYDQEDAKNTRHMAIYRFTPDYKGIEEELLWTRGTGDDSYRREAPWLFKRGEKYYMTMSHTRGWNPSETYYWTAESLYGPWTEEGQVEMNPPSRTSFNSQHRYIMEVGNGQWIFGGDRYPLKAPDKYPEEEGQNIILPVTWDGDKPVVSFEDTWLIDAAIDNEPDLPAEIENNVQWFDDRGVEIKSNDGGHITQFNDTYFWVGNDLDIEKNGNDIHLYSSKTLGSSDWKWEGKMVDYEPGRYQGSCTLVQNPATNKYLIICKGLNIYESENINGPYENTMNIWPSMVPFHTGYVWGGMSIYQEAEDAYLVVSRFDAEDVAGTRHMGVYRLSQDYKGLEEEVSWVRGASDLSDSHAREAPWIFKKSDKYYMTMSHTRGWNPSETYYWTAESLYGPWTEEGQVEMNPPSRTSFNSQHRYIMPVGKNGEQWIFGGDRYPLKEPDRYPEEEGQNIILPVTWDGDKPVVNFKEMWKINVGQS